MAPFNRFLQLSSLDAGRLASWLAQAPVLERMAVAPPKLDPYFMRLLDEKQSKPVKDVRRLADLAGSPTGIAAVLGGLDTLADRLVLSAAWNGGSMQLGDLTASRDWPTDADTAARMALELTAAAAKLRFLLLAEPEDSSMPGVLRLAADVLPLVDLPARSVLDGMISINSEELAATLRAHKVRDIPTRRDERNRVFLELLADHNHLHAIVGTLPAEARAVLDILLRRLEPTTAIELGLRSFGSLGREYKPSRYAPAPAVTPSPLHSLDDLGLIGSDPYEGTAWVWREVAQALRPQLIASWVTMAPPTPVVVDASRSHIAYPIATLERLLDLWRASPPPALADGGLGVVSVRSVAKKMAVPPGHVGLLVHLGVGLGLLRSSSVGVEGRGRNARHVYGWATTDAVPQWLTLSAVERWASLVHLWLTDESLVDVNGLPERWQPGGFHVVQPMNRHLVLRALEELTPGTGIAADELAFMVAQSWPRLLSVEQATAAVEAARALGLVGRDDPIGLTTSARALLDGHVSELELPTGNDSGRSPIVVQADLTVIATPDVDLDARLFLDRIATLESDAGARVYRLTEASLTTAMAGGLTADHIETGLTSRSRTALPQPVSYLIRDVDRKRNLVVLASAVTVVASSDPVLIVSAARVKAAGLRLIGLYTAVSALPAEKVRVALAAKGVIVTVEQRDAPPPSPHRSPVVGAAVAVTAPGSSPYVGAASIRATAARLVPASQAKRRAANREQE